MRKLTGYHHDTPPPAHQYCDFCCFSVDACLECGCTEKGYLPCTYLDHRPVIPPAINKLRPS
ncbi:hypothetical protein CS536_02580 [Yersinia kristensenii]|nr:hypothetical protein CS536_02580 [Yersinia kristensenii]PJE83967.1 hypothetical protein CU276_10760 [Yersinia kristensenii]